MPMEMPTPVRGTDERTLNRFNLLMHQQPWYQALLQQWGLAGREGAIRLSRSQQAAVEREMRRQGIPLPSSMHIDQGGNLNQKNRLGRNLAIGGGAAIGAFTVLPALLGGGAASGAAGTAAGGAGAAGGAAAAGGAGAAGAGLGATASGIGAEGMLAGLGMGGAPISTVAPTLAGVGGAAAGGVGAGAAGAAAGGIGGILRDPQTYADAMSILGGFGEGLAEERGLENLAQARTDQARVGRYGVESNARQNVAELTESATRDRANRALTAPATRSRQAVISQILANLRPMSVSGLPAGVVVPNTSGGSLEALRSSPQANQALRLLTEQALQAMVTGSDVPAMPDTSNLLVTPPELGQYRQPGTGETAASLLGTGGSVLSNILRRRNRQGG